MLRPVDCPQQNLNYYRKQIAFRAATICKSNTFIWITHDPWFRVATTLFGMTVTDCWKAYKYALPEKHPKKQIRLVEFADRMTYDLVHNRNSTARDGGGSLMLPLTIETGGASLDSSTSGVVSPLTQATVLSLDTVCDMHRFVDNLEIETDKNGREWPMRRKCNHMESKRKCHKLCSHYKCRQRSYNVNGTVKYGYFYCKDHKIDHWMDVINGSIGYWYVRIAVWFVVVRTV